MAAVVLHETDVTRAALIVRTINGSLFRIRDVVACRVESAGVTITDPDAGVFHVAPAEIMEISTLP